MRDLFHQTNDWGDVIHITVTSRASANRIKVTYKEDGTRDIRVYVTAIPVNGAANEAVLTLLAKEMGIARTRLQITHGTGHKHKTIRVLSY